MYNANYYFTMNVEKVENLWGKCVRKQNMALK